MNKEELKALSKKYLGSESKYIKMMEKGVLVPYQPKEGEEKSKIHTTTYKRYSLQEIEDLFATILKKEADLKEKRRLESLAQSVRAVTGTSK